jgi:hypothetical protein
LELELDENRRLDASELSDDTVIGMALEGDEMRGDEVEVRTLDEEVEQAERRNATRAMGV